MSAELVRTGRHIRNIGLAPDLIIQFVYPYEGNEKAIGLNFRKIPNQWPSVKRAIDNQSTIIAGPLTLAQGGTAMIARTPIFIDPPENTQLWGMSSIVININSLFDAVELEQMSTQLNIAIRGKDGLGADGDIIYGTENHYEQATAKEVIRFPSGEWIISASSKNISSGNFFINNLIRIVGYPLALSLVITILLLLALYKKSHSESMRDPLTGLANRRLLEDRLEHSIQQHRRKKQGFSVINIDLDGFKPINDNFGHDAGDHLLQQIALRLKQSVRASDTVARTGGDEFLLLLPELHEELHIRQMMKKIQTRISQPDYQFKGQSLNIGASLGWAKFPEDGENAAELLHKSDKRMYHNKFERKKEPKEKTS